MVGKQDVVHAPGSRKWKCQRCDLQPGTTWQSVTAKVWSQTIVDADYAEQANPEVVYTSEVFTVVR